MTRRCDSVSCASGERLPASLALSGYRYYLYFVTAINPTTTLIAFDRFLHAEGLAFEAVVIGGAALHVLGVVTRVTEDVDVLVPEVPPAIADAAARFAIRADTEPEDSGWFNSKSNDFVHVSGCLPDGWRERLRPLFHGDALRLDTLGRLDLLCTKLVAMVDRGVDFGDCVALAPTAEELAEAWPFVANYEANPESREVYWVPRARAYYVKLADELGHGIS